MPEHGVARIAQESPDFSGIMAVIHIQLFTKFFFTDAANHTTVIFGLAHGFPLFVG